MVVNIYGDYLLADSFKEKVGFSCILVSPRAHSPAGRLVTQGSGERLIFMVTDGDTGMESPRVTALP